MIEKIHLKLKNGYSIFSQKNKTNYSIFIKHDEEIIGKASLVTDSADVACIMDIAINNNHVDRIVVEPYTLGDLFIKFLIKFPTMTRKIEFRFILDAPNNLQSSIAKYHFSNLQESNSESNIFIRQKAIIPKFFKRNDITVEQKVNVDDLPALLKFLQQNAYWQKKLTVERLKILVDCSHCFSAKNNAGQLVGFARVVTDAVTFASLWDVVVDEANRRMGIGTALMAEIFSDASLEKIPTWLLFTDTAKNFYEQFGFGSCPSKPSTKIMYKLRLQDSCPSYNLQYLQVIAKINELHFNPEQGIEFLIGRNGKRHKLPFFLHSFESNEVQVDTSYALSPQVTFNK